MNIEEIKNKAAVSTLKHEVNQRVTAIKDNALLRERHYTSDDAPPNTTPYTNKIRTLLDEIDALSKELQKLIGTEDL